MSKTLILVPTELELARIAEGLPNGQYELQLCGFGLAAAAARTALLLERTRPHNVILAGIAGSYDRQIARIGNSLLLSAVRCDGIGVGAAETFCSAEKLGWHQWNPGNQGMPIGDLICLSHSESNGAELLSVCAASASPEHASLRRQQYPDAVVEDMEGYAVAMACQMLDTPLTIIRGISNIAGERDKSQWKIADALKATAVLVAEQLNRTTQAG